MFIGHFAVAFAVKRVAPEVRLGTAVVAVTLLDLIWPLLVAAGIEAVRIDPGNTAFTPLDFVSYPYSHSLLMTLVWSAVFGWLYRRGGGSMRGAVWLGLAVASHWFLDFIVHRPDLPLMPGWDMRAGLGLWHSIVGTVIVEGLLFVLGLSLYLAATRARDRIGRWGLWGLVVLLITSYTGAGASPPPSVTAIVVADLAGTALAVAWAYWVDRHRDVVTPAY